MLRVRLSVFAVGIIALVLAAILPALPATAGVAKVYTSFFSSTALGGYDPVAYFTEGKPVQGSSKHSLTWNGATWNFASATNKEQFAADPQKYAPAYGGYCAWAVAQGYTASGDPQYWAVHDGRLFLNYNADVQNRWDANPEGFIKSADVEWPKLIAE